MGVWPGTASPEHGICGLLQGRTEFNGRTFARCFSLGCVGLSSAGPFLHKKLVLSLFSRKHSAHPDEIHHSGGGPELLPSPGCWIVTFGSVGSSHTAPRAQIWV